MEPPVKDLLDQELRQLGFTRKGNAWRRPVGDVTHIVALQKSRWGKSYYLNLAVWVGGLPPEANVKSADCPLQSRIGSIPNSPAQLEAALTEEDYWRMDAAERASILKLALGNAELMFFSKLKSLPDLIDFVRLKPWPQLVVRRELSELAT